MKLLNLDSKIVLWVFFFTSYILGNLLNIISHEFFTKEKHLGIKNDINEDEEIKKLKENFSIQNDAYDLIKKYIDKSGYPNFVRKFEAKYLLYRNITMALFISYTCSIFKFGYNLFLMGNAKNIDYLSLIRSGILGGIFILTAFYQYKYYWGKVKKEISETLFLIRSE